VQLTSLPPSKRYSRRFLAENRPVCLTDKAVERSQQYQITLLEIAEALSSHDPSEYRKGDKLEATCDGICVVARCGAGPHDGRRTGWVVITAWRRSPDTGE